MPERKFGLMMAALAALTWSGLAIALKVAVGLVSAETIVWFRFLVAFVGILFYLVLFKPGELKIFRKPPLLAILAGLGLAGNYIGFMKGVELTTPSNAQILIQFAPVTLILTGVFFFKEKLNKLQLLGIFIAVFGFYLFFNDQLKNSGEEMGLYIEGDLWLLFAVVTWVFYAAFNKVLVQKFNPQTINFILYTVALVVLTPIADFSEIPTWSFSLWILMIVLGLNTILAYGALGIAFKKAPASQISLVLACNPILTLVFMKILAWQEVTWIKPDVIGTIGYLGAFLVIGGVTFVVSYPSNAK